MIERALRELSKGFIWYCGTPTDSHLPFDELVKALTDQAIVIECEVEHSGLYNSLEFDLHAVKWTNLLHNGLIFARLKNEHHGIPGKAIAIILPLQIDD